MRRLIPTNTKREDCVQTPLDLAIDIVNHFKPQGAILEPCKGNGNFLQFLPGADWCEINEGRDFFQWSKRVDWIITNPPWSKIRDFLNHSMCVAQHIVFLMTVNHVWTKALAVEGSRSGCAKTVRRESSGIANLVQCEVECS